MSKQFTVTTRNGFSSTRLYQGDTVVQMIEKNILKIGQDAGLGNASGFRLSSAKIVPAQRGATLVLTGTGTPMAHKADDRPEKTVHIDLPDADIVFHVFKLG